MKRVLAILKTLIFTILVPGYVAVVLPESLRKNDRPLTCLGAVIGAPLILAGLVIYLRCAWDFAYTGLGTPAPIDPPKLLIVQGLHRFIRNPMYVGVVLVILGQAALFHSLRVLVYGSFFFCWHTCSSFFMKSQRWSGSSVTATTITGTRFLVGCLTSVGGLAASPERNC